MSSSSLTPRTMTLAKKKEKESILYKDCQRKPVQVDIVNIHYYKGGAWGMVYTGIAKNIPGHGTNEKVALKKPKIRKEDLAGYWEVKLLRKLTATCPHDNLINLLLTRCNEDKSDKTQVEYTIVMPFMPISLLDVRNERHDVRDIKIYMWQLFFGLDHLRKMSIIHRDVKPANLLVEPHRRRLKIGDFGSATFADRVSTQTTCVVTRNYRPPEILYKSVHYDCMADIWSAGCVFAELFLGRTLFSPKLDADAPHEIYKLFGTPSGDDLIAMKVDLNNFVPPRCPEALPPDSLTTLTKMLRDAYRRDMDYDATAKLIIQILNYNPNMRPHGIDLLGNEYFTEIFERGNLTFTDKERILGIGTMV